MPSKINTIEDVTRLLDFNSVNKMHMHTPTHSRICACRLLLPEFSHIFFPPPSSSSSSLPLLFGFFFFVSFPAPIRLFTFKLPFYIFYSKTLCLSYFLLLSSDFRKNFFFFSILFLSSFANFFFFFISKKWYILPMQSELLLMFLERF